jgi:hypothetical protein
MNGSRCGSVGDICGSLKGGQPITWEAILKDYEQRWLKTSEFERFNSRRDMPTLEKAIETAALSEDENGEIYDHQRRPHYVWPDAYPAAASALARAVEKINDCKNFDELHCVIEAVLKDTFGRGSNKELYAYDVAFRIGAWMGLLPDKVYLHAGVRKGAEALGMQTRGRRTIQITELRPQLRSLPAWQLEDILCIYAKRFPRR